jgi:hypothetical protein
LQFVKELVLGRVENFARALTIPIPNLLKYLIIPNLEETICLDCLRKGRLTYLVFDYENGEISCPEEGIVLRKNTFYEERPARERPSPLKPPE